MNSCVNDLVQELRAFAPIVGAAAPWLMACFVVLVVALLVLCLVVVRKAGSRGLRDVAEAIATIAAVFRRRR